MSGVIAIPRPERGWTVPWDELQGYDWVQAWKSCPQDPIYHAEGNVWIHTRMVLEELVADPAWRGLPAKEAEIVYLAAVLHDVAKPSTTQVREDGRVSARGHSPRGAIDARRILWEMGYPFAIREAVCALIRYHQVPYFLADEPAPLPSLARLSQTARCDLLELLSRADIKGRVCEDPDRPLENIELFGLFAREHGCVRDPLAFRSDHSRFRYFRGGGWTIDSEVDDDTRSEVILMSGLPGAGKDRWVAAHAADLPVISLDAIRGEFGVDAGDDQGMVRRTALERARELLRQGQSLVWNATNLHVDRRADLIALFDKYRARVRIVYVEAPAERLLAQNAARPDPVPERVIRSMMRRWQIPDRTEAHQVEYVIAEPENVPAAPGEERAKENDI
jgi:predicted kinase